MLVCIQGEWSNAVDVRLKGRLATLAMGGQGEAAYTLSYARAVHSPRPWGVTTLLAEHTGAHQPLDVDWLFARESHEALLDAGSVARQGRLDALRDAVRHATCRSVVLISEVITEACGRAAA